MRVPWRLVETQVSSCLGHADGEPEDKTTGAEHERKWKQS